MIITNGGGPGVIAVDQLDHSGGRLAEISEEGMKAFNDYLPKVSLSPCS